MDITNVTDIITLLASKLAIVWFCLTLLALALNALTGD